jgi:hypothetical protein
MTGYQPGSSRPRRRTYRGREWVRGGGDPGQILADVLPGRLVPNTLGGFPMFAGAIALIVGALVAGSEYGWGTLKTIVVSAAKASASCSDDAMPTTGAA